MRIGLLFILVFFITDLLAQGQEKGGEQGVNQVAEKTAMEMINEANKKAQAKPTESLELATKGLEKSLVEKNTVAQNQAYLSLGMLYFNAGEYEKAKGFFDNAKAGFTILKMEKEKSIADKYSIFCIQKQNIEEQQTDYNYSWNNAKQYRSKGKKKEAVKELKKIADNKNVSETDKINIYLELGELYLEMKDTQAAIASFSNTTNSAVLKQIEKLKPEELENYSRYNLLANGADNNLLLQKKVLQVALKSRALDLVPIAQYNLGNTYAEKGEFFQSINYYQASATTAKETGKPQIESKSLKELSKILEKTGDYKSALEAYKRYVFLFDSFQNVQDIKTEERKKLDKEFGIQEEKIRALLGDKKVAEERVQNQRRTIIYLILGLGVLGILIYALFRNIRLKQKANLQIKLRALTSQMNPHFIFNSMNSLNNFIGKKEEIKANKYISDFSKLMRSVLKSSNKTFIPFADEIEILRIYLQLEHMRFSDKFDYTLDIDEHIALENILVPPMLIQPHIENAIWHGLRYKEEKGLLSIQFTMKEKNLYCTIQDNGIGRKKSAELKTIHQKQHESTGITNSDERIKILNKLHKTNLEIAILDLEKNGEALGTEVSIKIPYSSSL